MRAFRLGAVLGLIIASFVPGLTYAQTTYQPVGSHVIYQDGSTDFYYTVTNPSNGQQTNITVFFYCSEHKATVINAGVYAPVDITATCLVPPNVGTVTVHSGGTTSLNGMTVTVNPSSWIIQKGACTRSGCILFVVNSSIDVPLTVQ